MSNRKILPLLAIVLSAAMIVGGCKSAVPSTNQTANVTEGINTGNRAIDFQLQALNGTTVKLSDYRGQPVLLNFWATWCGPCRGEVPFLDQINASDASKGLVMLAVDVGENSTIIQNFMTSLNVSLPVLMDSDTSLSKKYVITGIPTTFMLDKDGIIRYKMVGAFPNKAAIETALTTIMP